MVNYRCSERGHGSNVDVQLGRINNSNTEQNQSSACGMARSRELPLGLAMLGEGVEGPPLPTECKHNSRAQYLSG